MSTAVLERPTELKVCTHQGNHQHGTQVMYAKDGCRCDDCRRAHAIAAKKRRRQIAYGRYDSGLRDPAPALAHITVLRESGVSLFQVHRLSGIAMSTLQKIVSGKTQRTSDTTINAVLSVEPAPENIGNGSWVEGTGTARRLQALVAIGWTQRKLAAKLGIAESHFHQIILNRRGIIADTHRKVAALYDQLWDQPTAAEGTPTERQARSHALGVAARKGWVSPLAWDDDTIDDPKARPAGVRKAGEMRDSIISDARHFASQGMTRKEIAARIGYQTPVGLIRLLERAAEHDLLARIRHNGAVARGAQQSRKDGP